MTRVAKDRWQIKRNSAAHRRAALQAADIAERVLPMFESAHPKDRRPREAIDAIRAWALGEIELSMAAVRKLSLAAHAAAREADTDAATFAARAAGHATWHVPRHAKGAQLYAAKALAQKERDQ